MSVITSTAGTKKLSAKLKRAGINRWVAHSSGDKWGKYLIFEVGGKCIGGAGYSLKEAAETVDQMIREKNAASI